MTDFRALCAELLAEWDSYGSGGDAWDRARVALAQPEPEGPSDEELLQLAIDTRLYRFQATAGDPIQYEMTEQQVRAYGRAVWARAQAPRGRPAIEPVPVAERLPGAEDCFPGDYGQRSYKCWAQQYHTDSNGEPLQTVAEAWDLVDYRLLARCSRWYYVWLPHWALPVPTSQENS